MYKIEKYILVSTLVLILTGCTTTNLYFGTQTSIGLDVSGTSQVPNKVSFAYDRSEVAIVPKKNAQEAHSVLGKLDADIGWFRGQKIKQIFATGEAAKNVARASNGGGSDEEIDSDTNGEAEIADTQGEGEAPLIFIAKSVFGLDINFGQQDISPTLVLGYKRSETTVIPVKDPNREVRSVYADISIDSTDPPTQATATDNTELSTKPSTISGVRIVQSFATGEAAVLLTRNDPEIRNKLLEAVGADLTEFTEGTGLEKEILVLFDEMEKNSPQKLDGFYDFMERKYGLTERSRRGITNILKRETLNNNDRMEILNELEKAGGDV